MTGCAQSSTPLHGVTKPLPHTGSSCGDLWRTLRRRQLEWVFKWTIIDRWSYPSVLTPPLLPLFPLTALANVDKCEVALLCAYHGPLKCLNGSDWAGTTTRSSSTLSLKVLRTVWIRWPQIGADALWCQSSPVPSPINAYQVEQAQGDPSKAVIFFSAHAVPVEYAGNGDRFMAEVVCSPGLDQCTPCVCHPVVEVGVYAAFSVSTWLPAANL